jgi:hypothetical protein
MEGTMNKNFNDLVSSDETPAKGRGIGLEEILSSPHRILVKRSNEIEQRRVSSEIVIISQYIRGLSRWASNKGTSPI